MGDAPISRGWELLTTVVIYQSFILLKEFSDYSPCSAGR